MKRQLEAARKLRDRLIEEGRHHDASIIQDLCRSAASSSGTNKILHRDNMRMKEERK